MTEVEYDFYRNVFDCIVHRAAQWTKDYRGLAKLTNIVCEALHNLYVQSETTPLRSMTERSRNNIVGCLEIIVNAAHSVDDDENDTHQTLDIQAAYVLKALNILFERNGLAPASLK